jgi:catechol 2,3-dioxygenase-like lactoylglutathione lyase family enzyme
MRVPLDSIHHFGVAVQDPLKSAEWWESHFELNRLFEFEDVVCVANSHFLLMLRRGTPAPETVGHTAFNVENQAALQAAVVVLREHGVKLEDPGDEIGPVGEGSVDMGLWFSDLDGYRWELFARG